ncbi:MAG: NADH-quinone oxidoreductase subunit 7 [Candidatus Omnitrophica bacterium]|nr:NADH-quinone oxidoreductase subunit 7 [Candidatus Omnitrophota bacterium]
MSQSTEYIGVLVAVVIAGTIATLILALNALLGPKTKPSAVKLSPFECGVPRLSQPTGRLSVKFYLVAMLFILFDVEIVWFFPWAVILRDLGWAGIAEMFTFAAVLTIGFVYAWKKGALDWEK